MDIPHSPVAALGTLTLILAFLVVAYAGASGVVGQRLNRPRLVQSSLYSMWAFTAIMTVASALIVYAFVTHDFRIKYVARYSDSTMPLFYLFTAYWGGLDGSLMFWVWMLSMFSAAALFVNRHRHRDMIGYVIATIAGVALFFLALLLYSKNPFATFLTAPPTEGSGLSPLLQTYWMAIHPPSLYTGYVGMTIPFAFAMGALASGRLDDSWLHSIRVWVIIPWFFLSLGLVLGGIWAYEELGWGGYWAWDPVENAGLFPWFTATAFLHSVMIQERRGMMKSWNVTLVIITFFLTIFGTFMTRSGIVQSVHAFGQDNELALLFLLFMAVMLVVAVGLLLYRLPALRSAGQFESFASREVAFLLNNWILLSAAIFVLFATMFPTLSEYVLGQRVTVGPPFFNKFMVPLGLVLLLLAGIAPLLAWRHTTQKKLLEQLMFPGAAAGVTVGVIALLWKPARGTSALFVDWIQVPMVLITYGVVALTFASILQEFWRGTRVRMTQSGSDFFSALVGVVVSKKRKYGGYVVHAGIALMFIGFAGKYYGQEKPVTVDRPGKSFVLGGYTFEYEQLTFTGDDHKDAATAKVTYWKGKGDKREKIGTLYPARWRYKTGNQETTSEVAIDRGFDHDVYVVLNGFEPQKRTANFTVYINPHVNFVWLGFGVLALGTVICLLPDSLGTMKPRRRTVANTAAGAALMILLVAGVLMGLTRLANAQAHGGAGHVELPNAQETRDVHPTVKKLWNDIVCLCGGCPRETLLECRCGFAAQERDKILALSVGRDLGTKEQQKAFYDEVVAAQMARHGGEHVLRMLPDKGFNRLAWILPYAMAGAGVGLVTFMVIRSVRRGKRAQREAAVPTKLSAEERDRYEDKLDDELRDVE